MTTVTYVGPLGLPITVQIPEGRAIDVVKRTVEVSPDEAEVLLATGEWEAAGQPTTIAEIKDVVGDDPDLAAQWLAAEQARTNPRSTLVDHLTSIVSQED